MDDFYKKMTRSRFYRFGDKLGDHILMSLLFILFSIPVITFVPSCAALYYAVRKRVFKDSSTPVKDFMHSLRTNLIQGIIIDIVYLIYTAAAGCCIFIGYYGIGDMKLPSFYFPLSLLLLLPVIFSFPFVVPCLARYENTTKRIFINGFTLSTMYMGKSLLTCLTMLLTLVITALFPPAVIFLPSVSCIFITNILEKAFVYTENKSGIKETGSINAEDDDGELS
ncbi:MAG: YesL family protein [Clostridiales bacterium]|nr:YesL family protein [Clostridiales bacterium]